MEPSLQLHTDGGRSDGSCPSVQDARNSEFRHPEVDGLPPPRVGFERIDVVDASRLWRQLKKSAIVERRHSIDDTHDQVPETNRNSQTLTDHLMVNLRKVDPTHGVSQTAGVEGSATIVKNGTSVPI